jgi:hypothetical protein
MKVLNGKVALEPFASTEIQTKNYGGFAVVAQKVQLIPLKVVFGNDEIQEGQTVYVHGDATKHPFANQIHELDGKKYILVPISPFIEMVQ